MEHLSVIRARQELQQKVRDMRHLAEKGQPLASQINATDIQGLFRAFEYQPSDYAAMTKAREKAALRQPDPEKVAAIAGGKAFVPNGMVPGGAGRRMKHEDLFGDSDYRFPHLGGEFSQADLDELGESWIQDSFILGERDFLPAGTAGLAGVPGAGSRPTPQALPEALAVIKGIVAEDWEGTAFDLLLDREGCIVVRFDLATVDSREGLGAYMNVLLKSNALLSRFLLARVPEYWNKERVPGSVDFTMRPPWVRNGAMGQAFLKLHPEYQHGLSVDVAGE